VLCVLVDVVELLSVRPGAVGLLMHSTDLWVCDVYLRFLCSFFLVILSCYEECGTYVNDPDEQVKHISDMHCRMFHVVHS
jgi:hypothetical protein